MWVLHFQPKRRWALDFRAVHTLLGADAQRIAAVVELLAAAVFAAFVLAVPFAIASVIVALVGVIVAGR